MGQGSDVGLIERRVEDLGTVDSAAPKLKSLLARKIARILKDRRLTVRAAEQATGFAAADFSRVRGGKTDRFTLDRLFAMLASLDPAAEISAGIRSRLSREAAVTRLRAHEADLRKLGVTSLHLFGSTARDEAGPNSDLDVYVEHGPGFGLLDLVGVKQTLEDGLGIEVHATTRDGLHSEMRAAIEREAIRVF
jgi:predicted nucleotidyltransferase/predicted XRE-type DNA-binding protein